MGAKFIKNNDDIVLIINDRKVTQYKKHFYNDEDDSDYCFINDDNLELDHDELNELLKFKMHDLPSFVDFYQTYDSNTNFDTYITIDCQSGVLALSVYIEIEYWTNPFYIGEFLECYESELTNSPYKVTTIKNDDSSWGLILEIPFSEGSNVDMLTYAKDAYDLLVTGYERTMVIMHSDIKGDVVTKLFDFPPEYANICSQYLIWFGEFLKNLGIDADVSTKNKDGKTSLIVSPAENGEMLEQIEELFYRYLALPYAELLPPEREMSIQEQHTFIAIKQQVQMLEMQVESQDFLLMNSKATITSLNTTIAVKDNLIETQADKLTLINALVDKEKWANVPFTEGTFKCKNFGKKTMSIQFEPLAAYNKLIKNDSKKDDE
jgi:hypothetical protein